MATTAAAGVGELAAPACSGALALRRITALLSGARRADAQGDYVQARDLYSEVLKVNRTLSRAPLGSIGKSLRDVVIGVEARLQSLRQELREGDSTTCSSSRPTTNCSAPSSSSKSSTNCVGPGRGNNFAGPSLVLASGREDVLAQLPGASASCSLGGAWPQRTHSSHQHEDIADVPDCPASAREGYGGRPTTRDGTAAGKRPCTFDNSTGPGRPNTSDNWRQTGSWQALDGTRPSTRDDLRLHQQLTGKSTHSGQFSARDHGHHQELMSTPRRPSRESRDRERNDSQRPQTRDSARPPTRSGSSQNRRCQDVMIRQVTSSSRRKRQTQQAFEVMSLEGASPVASPSPVQSGSSDDSVELLE
mmetsp:Transcript_46546/g.84101  ORF Transcript_46546/g.84101 Transcript_46546/m.84101 type:complete len:362 (-) Transcript_46546:274-1359(-)